MSEGEDFLFRGEEVALTVRPHPVVMIKACLPPLAAIALVASTFNSVTLFMFFVIMLRFAWDIAHWWMHRYVLTTKRILNTSGILSKKVASMPLAKITDLTFTRSLGGRILGYGKMHLESAGEEGLETIDFLPDPLIFYRGVMSLSLGPQPEPGKVSEVIDEQNTIDITDDEEDHDSPYTRSKSTPLISTSDD